MVVTVNFEGYPITDKVRMSGSATISLEENIPVVDDKTGTALIPIDRPLRWSIDDIVLPKAVEKKTDGVDLVRWLTGKYGYAIESLLYKEMAKKHKLKGLEEFYSKFAEAQLKTAGQP